MDDKEDDGNENDFTEGSVWWLLSHTDLEATTGNNLLMINNKCFIYIYIY